MKKKILFIAWVASAALFFSLFTTSLQTGRAASFPTDIFPVGQGSGWVMTFNDDFNGTTLDRTLWSSTFSNGGNGQLQQYVSDDSHNNYIVQNGTLQIVARQDPLNGKAYTSGVIQTRNSFQQMYGYFEIRAQVPAGMALWPAFWMIPDQIPAWPEVDIQESLGQEPTWALMNYHYIGSNGQIIQDETFYDGPDFTAGMHVYGLDWEPGAMIWYIDGVERKRFTDASNLPTMPLFMIVDLAVGGYWAGTPDATTVFPAYLTIDYVRAWQKVDPPTATPPAPTNTPPAPTATPPPTPTSTPQPNYYGANTVFFSLVMNSRQ